MSANSNINSLLKIDALELLKGLPFAPAEVSDIKHERPLGYNRVFELPDFQDDLFLEWEEFAPLDIREVPETDVDVLAWYQPYSNFGEVAWGIYFDTAKMNQHALLVYRVAKAVRPDIRPSTVVRAVWDEVMRHEREHAVQELTLAVLVQMGLHPAMDSNSVYFAASDTFEALAAHYQQTDAVYRKPTSNTIDRNYVRHITSSIKKPLGYEDWDRINLDEAAKQAYGRAFFPDSALEVARRTRKLLRKVLGNTYLELPIYMR